MVAKITPTLTIAHLLFTIYYHENSARDSPETHGEIESAVCQGVARFEQDYMGRGPKDIHAHLLGDFLVVRSKAC